MSTSSDDAVFLLTGSKGKKKAQERIKVVEKETSETQKKLADVDKKLAVFQVKVSLRRYNISVKSLLLICS